MSCYEGNYFLNNKCYTSCPFGYYDDFSVGVCTPCDSSCEDCNMSPSDCLSCPYIPCDGSEIFPAGCPGDCTDMPTNCLGACNYADYPDECTAMFAGGCTTDDLRACHDYCEPFEWFPAGCSGTCSDFADNCASQCDYHNHYTDCLALPGLTQPCDDSANGFLYPNGCNHVCNYSYNSGYECTNLVGKPCMAYLKYFPYGCSGACDFENFAFECLMMKTCDWSFEGVQLYYPDGCSETCNYRNYYDDCVAITGMTPCEIGGDLFPKKCDASCDFAGHLDECVALLGEPC